MKEVYLTGLPRAADEITIQQWFYEEGDAVSEGEDLLEVSVDEEVFMVSSPVSGILTEVYYDEGESVTSEDVACLIDDES